MRQLLSHSESPAMCCCMLGFLSVSVQSRCSQMLCKSAALVRTVWRPAAVRQSAHARCMATAQAYSFGQWPIAESEVFASSKYSFAFVNLKPLVPGHVLVAPRRSEPRFGNLSSDEVTDLWALAQRVGSALEGRHNADALTLTVQDGPAAGQTVPHVHIHVLPRKFGDFEPNDKIYYAIDETSKADAAHRSAQPLNLDAERKPRTPEQMAAEAAELRPLLGSPSADS